MSTRPDNVNAEPKTWNSEQYTETPPLLHTWFQVYAFVLGELAFLIVVFYLFRKAFE